jgi:prepilin-type N-terminal cleavage/methylation domain-containing protein
MKSFKSGFTLAELLIALAILGVIATFTIPKVLNSATSGQNTSVAKEVAGMISGAFSSYTLNNTLSTSSEPESLTPYMNYVSIVTTGTIGGLEACSATLPCMKLHSGAVLQYGTGNTFSGTAATDAVLFNLDPDGSGSTGAATFVLYANGRLTTRGVGAPGSTGAGTAATDKVTAITTDPTYIANW